MKTFFALFLLLTALPLWAQPPTTGLVLHLPFSGNANDASGNGLHGTVHGAAPTADRFGAPNKAYSFDGISNYIDIPDNAALEPTSLTLSVWMQFDQTPPGW